MAYSTYLEDRIKRSLDEKNVPYHAKKMFGGLSFMIRDKMCVGIIKDNLMARVGPEYYEEALAQNGCRKMDFTKREMKGYVYVNDEGIDTEDDLSQWIDHCLVFNEQLTNK